MSFVPSVRPILTGLTLYRIGHRMRFLDRRQLIQTLYDKLKDKSRVHKSSEISKIEMTDSSVFIKTKNGTTTRGSILVGADGVHSRVREEMWRIADIEKPGYISAAERNCNYLKASTYTVH